MINGVQNQQQGRLYSSFLTTCGVNDGDEFLAVPLPDTTPSLPTSAICNAG